MYLPKRLLWNKPSAIKIVHLVWKVRKHTLLGYEPLFQNYQLIESLDKNDINGAIVECGSWKGGSAAFMAKVSQKQTWLFDSFEGMPDRDNIDNKIPGKRPLEKGDLAVSIKHTEEIVQNLGVQENTHIVKGWFEDTLPKHKKDIGPISLLRIDGDFYSSTITILRELYDQVQNGGYIIFDDFHDFEGCRKAIYDFFIEKNIQPDIRDYYPLGKPFIQKLS